MLSITSIGKEGLVLNELRLRGAIDFSYLLDLLCQPASLSLPQEEAYSLEEPSEEGFDLIKIPILDFIYYVYLESEKMAEELNKNNGK